MEHVMEQNVMERSGLRVEPLTPGLVRDYAVVTGSPASARAPARRSIGRVETAIGRLGTNNTYVHTHLA